MFINNLSGINELIFNFLALGIIPSYKEYSAIKLGDYGQTK